MDRPSVVTPSPPSWVEDRWIPELAGETRHDVVVCDAVEHDADDGKQDGGPDESGAEFVGLFVVNRIQCRVLMPQGPATA